MRKPLIGTKIAVLVANGFNEAEFTSLQRALVQTGANVRIVSSDQGLVNGWTGDAWGHHYAVDTTLGSALGADYTMLVIPGGTRSIAKLKLTAHTKRFIGSFMATGKPVAVFSDALDIMVFTDNVRGRTVTGPGDFRDLAVQAGAEWSDKKPCIDGNLVTGTEESPQAAIEFFIASTLVDQAA